MLDRADKGGRTLRQRYEDEDKDYDEPYPLAAGYIIRWFWQLRGRTPHGYSGPQPICWSEIDAWANRSGVIPEPWEIGVIELLDNAFLTPAEIAEKPPDVLAADAKVGLRSGFKDRRVVKRRGNAAPPIP